MKYYTPIIKKYKIKLIVLSLAIVLSSILLIGITYIGGIYIDIISVTTKVNTIYLICVFLTIISAINLILKYLISYITKPLIEIMGFDLQYYVLNHLKHISIIEYKKFNASYLSKRIEEDSKQIVQFFVNNYTTVIIKAIEILIIIAIVFRVNILLGLIMLTLCPIYYSTYKKFGKPIYDKNFVAREKYAEYFQELSNYIDDLENIIVEADFDKDNHILTYKYNTYIGNFKEYVSVINKFTLAQGGIVVLMQVTIYLIGGMSVFKGYTTIGQLSILLSYFLQILGNITYYNEFAKLYQVAKTAVHRMNLLLQIPSVKEGDKKINDIRVIDAKVSFKIEEQLILKNIKVSALKGDIIGIIGRNGAGKTTLLKLLMGVLKLNGNDESQIIINNKYNISKVDTIYMRRHNMAYVPQRIRFRDITMKEVFNEKQEYNEAREFINFLYSKDIPLTKKIEVFINDNWNAKMETLSGGDKQMVAILRCIIKNASVLILDEPTANLDVERGEWFCKMVQIVKKDKIIFIITHEDKMCSIFNKIINLGVE